MGYLVNRKMVKTSYPNNRKEVYMTPEETNRVDAADSVRTSRLAKEQERNVLSMLRSIAPRRRVTAVEIRMIAELQANRLLQLAGITEPPTPYQLIAELPRVAVRHDDDLPVSGSAFWVSGRWLICINSAEPWTRQRFSAAHELKHVIDHRHVATLYANAADAEAAAEYFAACLLMPKRAIYAAWASGNQRIQALAQAFEVHPNAMTHRLHDLGLLSHPLPPHVGVPVDRTGSGAYYQRQGVLQGARS
jgi:hypothetical protein